MGRASALRLCDRCCLLCPRFNAAKIIEQLIPLLGKPVVDQSVRSPLLELTEDLDTDVRFFASHALIACG